MVKKENMDSLNRRKFIKVMAAVTAGMPSLLSSACADRNILKKESRCSPAYYSANTGSPLLHQSLRWDDFSTIAHINPLQMYV